MKKKNSYIRLCFSFAVYTAAVFLMVCCTGQKNTSSMNSILEQQLKKIHTEQNWFVPINIALEGVTEDQSNWKDGADNHSIVELVSHLLFWNERVLIAYKGKMLPDFNENNELTFKKYNNTSWNKAQLKLDSLQTEWESVIKNATRKQLNEWNGEILDLAAHNSYHTGQIIYIRKLNHWWD